MKKAKITLNILAVISFIFGALYCFSLVFIPIGVYCFAAGRLFAYKADHMMDSYSADKKTLSRYFVFVAIVCFHQVVGQEGGHDAQNVDDRHAHKEFDQRNIIGIYLPGHGLDIVSD